MIDLEKNSANQASAEQGFAQVAKLRCPSCYKLYSITASEIRETKPKFECVSCQQRFWVPFPEVMNQSEAMMGFPMEWLSPKDAAKVAKQEANNTAAVIQVPQINQTTVMPDMNLDVTAGVFTCPSCEAPYRGGDTECKSCGIVFKKFELKKSGKVIPPSSEELRDAWESVIAAYDDLEVHKIFAGLALREQYLEYALSRYQQVLEVNPTDNIAKDALNRISAMAVARLESKIPVEEEKKSFLNLPKLRMGTLMLFLCGIVITMGLVIPGARNLVGMGSAFLFLLLALRYYFRII